MSRADAGFRLGVFRFKLTLIRLFAKIRPIHPHTSNRTNSHMEKTKADQTWKCWPLIAYGLWIIWTGIFRCIEAAAYKPNALWFCMVTGLMGIAAGFLYRLNRSRLATSVALASSILVLGLYFFFLIKQPEKDATFRVGLALVAAIAAATVSLLPPARR